MSLSIFGKTIPGVDPAETANALRACADHAGAFVRFDDLDREDLASIEAIDALSSNGLVFSVSSDLKVMDATSLWHEATAAAVNSVRGLKLSVDQIRRDMRVPAEVLDSIASTRIGRLCADIMRVPCHAGGLAFVEGGIESIVEASPRECLDRIFGNLLLPWDVAPGTLYVWRPSTSGGG